ncbi:GAF domain-containing protein [Pseudanabaenaceae cyanobacterium LEGE 13415]|nr:GAF domain-containing protein [Pseudanabaenaceae cyanobacterium LEGE 13415]
MSADKYWASDETPVVSSSEVALHDWSQTPLGAIETWSDDLKMAVQHHLTELAQAKSTPKTSQKFALLQNGAASALPQVAQVDAFRVRLMNALRPLRDATEIQAIAARILGEALGASRVIYIEVVSDGEEVIVHRNYTKGVAQLSGRYRLEDYRRNLTADHQAGRTQIVTDIPNHPEYTATEKENYREIDIAAHIDVPLIKNGQFVALLAVHHATPRQWTATEVKLAEETAEQTWATVERARAEAALRESEQKYRSLFESMNDGFCIIELIHTEQQQPIDYRFLEVNPAFERQSGLSDPVGKTGLHFAPNHDPKLLANYQQALITGEPIEFEIAMADLGRYYRISASRHGDPEKKQLAIIFNDISDRKQSEEIVATDLANTRLLRNLSARLIGEDTIQVLYDEIVAAAIALTRADAGTVQIVDDATQDILLLAAQGFDRTITDGCYRIDRSFNTSCGVALATGTRAIVDFDRPECDDPHGSLRLLADAGFCCAQSTPLISRSGRMIGMVSTHWRRHHRPSDRELRFLDLLARQAADLIEQRQTEAQRQRSLERDRAAREEAERANRIKDEFLAVLSHELRSPLNPILGWSRLLQQGRLDASKTAEAINTIERNAKLQSQLIEDLLDISRIMQGKLSLTVTPVNLSLVISAAIETVRLAAEAKQIQITLELDPAVSSISGDAARLQQVVWNLLTNAVKFTPNGGQVTVELRQLNQVAEIRVMDTGKGINPDFLPYVFEYFRQEDGSTTRKFGGLGLGLAIAKQIVEMHGGTVLVESQGEGQGATFIVQLPTMQQTTSILSRSTQNQIDGEVLLAGIQILLVDDEPDSLEFQAFLLEQYGARVKAVASGIEALQVLEQFVPDVLISDIGMAEMDGYMLLQQIRNQEASRRDSHPLNSGETIPAGASLLKAIALTAYAAEADHQRVLQVGFQTHLTKPVEPEQLVKTIASLLKRN